MEGRWAKLTLCAHLNNFIDIKKPIHPIAEELIFRYTFITENLRFYGISPTLSEEGNLLYNKEDWIRAERDCILPTDNIPKTDSSEESGESEQSKLIAQWALLNKKGDNE